MSDGARRQEHYIELFKFFDNSTGLELVQGLAQVLQSYTDLSDHDYEKLFAKLVSGRDPQARILVQTFLANNRGQIPYFRSDSPHANRVWARLSMEMTMKTWRNLATAGSFDTSPGIMFISASEPLGVIPLLRILNNAIRWNAIMVPPPPTEGKKTPSPPVKPSDAIRQFLTTVADGDQRYPTDLASLSQEELYKWFENNSATLMKLAISNALTVAVNSKKLERGVCTRCLFPDCKYKPLDGCHYCTHHREVFFLEAGCRSLRAYTLGATQPRPELLAKLVDGPENSDDVPFFHPLLLTLCWLPCLEGFNAGRSHDSGLIPVGDDTAVKAANGVLNRINALISTYRGHPNIKLMNPGSTMLPRDAARGTGQDVRNSGTSKELPSLELSRVPPSPAILQKLFQQFGYDGGTVALGQGRDSSRNSMLTTAGVVGGPEKSAGYRRDEMLHKNDGFDVEPSGAVLGIGQAAHQKEMTTAQDGCGGTCPPTVTATQKLADEGTKFVSPENKLNSDHIVLPAGYIVPEKFATDIDYPGDNPYFMVGTPIRHITPLNKQIYVYKVNGDQAFGPFRGSLAYDNDGMLWAFIHDGDFFQFDDIPELLDWKVAAAPGAAVTSGTIPIDDLAQPTPIMALGSGTTQNNRMTGLGSQTPPTLEITPPAALRGAADGGNPGFPTLFPIPIVKTGSGHLRASIELALKSLMAQPQYYEQIQGNAANPDTQGLWASGCIAGKYDDPAKGFLCKVKLQLQAFYDANTIALQSEKIAAAQEQKAAAQDKKAHDLEEIVRELEQKAAQTTVTKQMTEARAKAETARNDATKTRDGKTKTRNDANTARDAANTAKVLASPPLVRILITEITKDHEPIVFPSPLLQLLFNVAIQVHSACDEESMVLPCNELIISGILTKMCDLYTTRAVNMRIKLAQVILGRDMTQESPLIAAVDYLSMQASQHKTSKLQPLRQAEGQRRNWTFFAELLHRSNLPPLTSSATIDAEDGQDVTHDGLLETFSAAVQGTGDDSYLAQLLAESWSVLINVLNSQKLAAHMGKMLTGGARGQQLTLGLPSSVILHNGGLYWSIVRGPPTRIPIVYSSPDDGSGSGDGSGSADGNATGSTDPDYTSSQDSADSDSERPETEDEEEDDDDDYVKDEDERTWWSTFWHPTTTVPAPAESDIVIGTREDAVVPEASVMGCFIGFLNTASEIALAHDMMEHIAGDTVTPNEIAWIIYNTVSLDLGSPPGNLGQQIIAASDSDGAIQELAHKLTVDLTTEDKAYKDVPRPTTPSANTVRFEHNGRSFEVPLPPYDGNDSFRVPLPPPHLPPAWQSAGAADDELLNYLYGKTNDIELLRGVLMRIDTYTEGNVSQLLKIIASLRRVLGYVSALKKSTAQESRDLWRDVIRMKVPSDRKAFVLEIDRKAFLNLCEYLSDAEDERGNFNEASYPTAVRPMFLREIMNVLACKTNGDATVFGGLLTAIGQQTYDALKMAHDRYAAICLDSPGAGTRPAAGSTEVLAAYGITEQQVSTSYGSPTRIEEVFITNALQYVLPQGKNETKTWFDKCLYNSNVVIGVLGNVISPPRALGGAKGGPTKKKLTQVIVPEIKRNLTEAGNAMALVKGALDATVGDGGFTVRHVINALHEFYTRRDENLLLSNPHETKHKIDGLFTQWGEVKHVLSIKVASDAQKPLDISYDEETHLPLCNWGNCFNEDGEVPDLPMNIFRMRAKRRELDQDALNTFVRVCTIVDWLSQQVSAHIQPLIQWTNVLTDCCLRALRVRRDGQLVLPDGTPHLVDTYQLDTSLTVYGEKEEALRMVKIIADHVAIARGWHNPDDDHDASPLATDTALVDSNQRVGGILEGQRSRKREDSPQGTSDQQDPAQNKKRRASTDTDASASGTSDQQDPDTKDPDTKDPDTKDPDTKDPDTKDTTASASGTSDQQTPGTKDPAQNKKRRASTDTTASASGTSDQQTPGTKPAVPSKKLRASTDTTASASGTPLCGEFSKLQVRGTNPTLEDTIAILRRWARDERKKMPQGNTLFTDSRTSVKQEDGVTEINAHATPGGGVYWWTDRDILHALRALGNGLNIQPHEFTISVSRTEPNRSATITHTDSHWLVSTNATATGAEQLVEESQGDARIPDGLHKTGGDCGPSAVAIALSWVCYERKPNSTIGGSSFGGGRRTLKTPLIHSNRTRKARKRKAKRDRTMRSNKN